MDVIIYIGIALAVAVVLFLLSSKKSPTAQTPSAPVAPSAKETPAKDGTAKPAGAAQKEPAKALQAKSEAAPAQRTPEAVPAAEDEPVAEGPPSGARMRPATAGTVSDQAHIAPARGAAPARDVGALREGLAKSREEQGFFGKLRSLLTGRKEISPELAEQLEDVLLSSDVGVTTTQAILERVRSQLSAGELKNETQVWQALRGETRRILEAAGAGGTLRLSHKPTVVLFVGVNGAGKTTTIGKLATKLRAQGKTCVLAAGDTFRAAAVQQLVVWGQRVGCEVVRGKDGADPGSVLFDAVKKAQELNADVVLADTAGRLHTKSNLMAEMQKIARTMGKALEGAPHEVLLVIDSTNGQNALAQAKEFTETLKVSGIVLTKLDGTAKGGVLLGISHSLKLPVRYVGLGERPDDLHEFVADDFIEALLGKDA